MKIEIGHWHPDGRKIERNNNNSSTNSETYESLVRPIADTFCLSFKFLYITARDSHPESKTTMHDICTCQTEWFLSVFIPTSSHLLTKINGFTPILYITWELIHPGFVFELCWWFNAVRRLWPGQIQTHANLPSYEDIFSPPTTRLPSRHPVWLALPGENFSATSNWQEDWMNRGAWNSFLIDDPSARVPGFDLVRSDWVLLNRYRTGHGLCAASLHQWGVQDNPFLSLRRGSNNGTHRRRVPADKVHWRPTGPPHC